MTTATKTRTDVLDEIREAIHDAVLSDLRDGANDYVAVRVWPDLDITTAREASCCIPESEYFGRHPHSVTVWSASGVRPAASREDGVFEWDVAYEWNAGAFQDEDGSWWTLSDRLVESLDLDDVMAEAEKRLDEADQLWWDSLDA